jgi:hypothetical protein
MVALAAARQGRVCTVAAGALPPVQELSDNATVAKRQCGGAHGLSNKALKQSRPGFGSAAEPPWPNSTCAASRRLQFGASHEAADVPLFAQPRGPGRAA